MNYLKSLKIAVTVFAIFVTTQSVVAATIPLPNIDILIKSIATKRVIVSSTDKDGNFSSAVPEEKGEFNVFLNDQSLSPFKMNAKNGIISGRVVILTEGTTTQDPAPVKIKKTKISKPIKSIKKATSTVQ